MEEKKRELSPEEMQVVNGGQYDSDYIHTGAWIPCVFHHCPECSRRLGIDVLFNADDTPPKGYKCSQCGYYIPISDM